MRWHNPGLGNALALGMVFVMMILYRGVLLAASQDSALAAGVIVNCILHIVD